MLHFEQIHLKKVVVHKDTAFSFLPGLHVIRGANRSGKSLVASAVPNLLYSTPPLAKKKNKAKAFLQKGSSISFRWRYGKIDCEAHQSLKGSGLHYTVIKNGTDLQIHGVERARSRIARLFPLQPEQFYTFVYLNASRQSVLIHGSETDRRTFFENLFSLNVYSDFHSKISARAQELKAKQANLKYIEEKLRSIRAELVKFPSDLKSQYVSSNAEYQKLLKRYNERQEEYTQLTTLVRLQESRKTKFSLKKLNVLLVKAKKLRSKLEKKYKRLSKQWAQWEEHSKTQLNRRKLVQKLDQLPNYSYEKIKKQLNSIEKVVSEFEEVTEKRTKHIEDIKLFKKMQPEYGRVVTLPLKALSRTQQEIEIQLDTKRKQLAIFQRLKKEPHCPTCQQSLSSKSFKSLITNLTDEISELETKLKKANNLLKWATVKEVVANLPKYDQKSHISALAKREKLNKRLKIAKLREQIEAALAGMPDPSDVEEPTVQPDTIMEKMTGVNERINLLTSEQLLEERIQEIPLKLSPDEAKERWTALKLWVTSRGRKIEALRDTVSDLRVKASRCSDLKRELKPLKKEYTALKAELEMAEIYSELLVAYGPRGLRLNDIQRLTKGYEKNLNRFASWIFPEPITFNTEMTSSGFKIWATRNGIVSEIDLLSGSESRCFALLSLIALLPFLPAKYRCDTVILDEMESQMDPKTLNLFATRFIPELCQLVPKVVVITPQPHTVLPIPDAKEYRIEKRAGKSRIIAR